MDVAEITVLAMSGLAVAGIVWYFFLGEKTKGQAVVAAAGYQEATVTISGGYDPAIIEFEAGTPARLHFFRDEDDSCSEQVLIPKYGLSRFLPPHETTTIEFVPEEPGRFPFHCGMNMMRGEIVVRVRDDG